MELNREQIVKALACCSVYETCDGCPLFNGVPEDDCHYKAMANALALIRELTEENERLRGTSEEGTLATTYSAMPTIDQKAKIKEMLEEQK